MPRLWRRRLDRLLARRRRWLDSNGTWRRLRGVLSRLLLGLLLQHLL